MAARFPRFIITVDGQQVALAADHDEAWLQTLALWRPGRRVCCEPAEEPAEAGQDEQPGEAREAGQAA